MIGSCIPSLEGTTGGVADDLGGEAVRLEPPDPLASDALYLATMKFVASVV